MLKNYYASNDNVKLITHILYVSIGFNSSQVF